jgi:hypothetical protein
MEGADFFHRHQAAGNHLVKERRFEIAHCMRRRLQTAPPWKKGTHEMQTGEQRIRRHRREGWLHAAALAR